MAEEDIAEGELVLQIWCDASGQWSGRLISDGVERGTVQDCASAEDVEYAAIEAGIYPDRVELL